MKRTNTFLAAAFSALAILAGTADASPSVTVPSYTRDTTGVDSTNASVQQSTATPAPYKSTTTVVNNSSGSGSDPNQIWVYVDETLFNNWQNTGEQFNGGRDVWAYSSYDVKTGAAFRFTNMNATNSVVVRVKISTARASDDTVKIAMYENGAVGCSWESYSGYTLNTNQTAPAPSCNLSRIVSGSADCCNITLSYLLTIPPKTSKILSPVGGVFNGSGTDTYGMSFGAYEIASSPAGTTAALAGAVGAGKPDAFTFTNVSGANFSQAYTSNAITVSGVGTGNSVGVWMQNPTVRSVTGSPGGCYIKNGNTAQCLTTPTTAVNGDTFALRVTSSSQYATTTKAMLIIGGVSSTYNVTTQGDPNPPDPCSNPKVICQ